MTVTVHTAVHGKDGAVQTIKKLQGALSVPVATSIDIEHISKNIVALQAAFIAANPASTKVKQRKYIDNEQHGQFLIELENAINAP